MAEFKKFHQKWLERVNSPLDMEMIETLLDPHAVLVESDEKYYVGPQMEDQDLWVSYNGDPEIEIEEISDKVSQIVFKEPLEKPINHIVWHKKEVDLPYSQVEHLLPEFNLDFKEIDKYFDVVPDIQDELPTTHFPRKWFPFRKDENVTWYMNIENGNYAAYDEEDTVFGFFIHDKKDPLKFRSKYAFGNEDVEEEEDEEEEGDE